MAITEAFINFGAETEFLSANGSLYNSMGVLTSSKFVVAYEDDSDDSLGKVKIGTVSGSTVTFGSGYAYQPTINATDSFVTLSVLNANTFVVVYQDETDSGHGTAKVGTVDGDTVTFGSEYEFLSTNRAAWTNSEALPGTSGFVVSYADWGDDRNGKLVVGVVSGTTISYGTPVTFYASNEVTSTYVSAFDSSGFVLAYRKGNAGHLQGAARIGSVTGDVVSVDTEVDFVTTAGSAGFSISAATIDRSQFVVGYKDDGDSGHGTARVGSISGTTITGFGTESEFLSSGATLHTVVARIDPTNFVVLYKDGADSNHGTVKIGSISGTSINFSDENEFLSVNGVDYIDLGILSEDQVVVSYTDASDSNHGTVKLGEASLNTVVSTSGDLFISGSMVAASEVEMRIINHLVASQDHNPQLTSTFGSPAASVSISVWDIVNGQNTNVILDSIVCYNMAGTNTWGWSTEHLPFRGEKKKYHYYYRMTSDIAEERFGEFFITVPERGRWSYEG